MEEFKATFNEKMLSLKNIALRRVSLKLWNLHPQLINDLDNIHDIQMNQSLQAEVSSLQLPGLIKKELVNTMLFMIVEISKFVNFHLKCLHSTHSEDLLTGNYINILYWTSAGTINYRKTIKKLIRCRNMNIIYRYKLACMYCFRHSVRKFWNQLPEDRIGEFYDSSRPLLTGQPELVIIWTYYMKSKRLRLFDFLTRGQQFYLSLKQYAFETSAIQGFRSATKYFFNSMNSEEKEISLLHTARKVARKSSREGFSKFENQKYCDVLAYLLSQMNIEQLTKILRTHSYATLCALIDSPNTDTFIELAKLAFPFLEQNKYCMLVYFLVESVAMKYNYPKIFQDLFIVTPSHFRRYFAIEYCYFFEDFTIREDAGMIRFILRNLKEAETAHLVFCTTGLAYCCSLVMNEKWNFLELYLREAKLSEVNRKRLIRKFVYHNFKLPRVKRKRFIMLLKEIIADNSK